MPVLDNWLHYRMIDVSSVKELARRWYPRAYFASPIKHGGHRALADIIESVQELGITARRCSCPIRGPTRRPRGRSLRGSERQAGLRVTAFIRTAGDRYTRYSLLSEGAWWV